MDKNSKVISIPIKDHKDFAIITDAIFEEHHVYIDGELKYIIGLYQDGDIWSELEEYGTYVVNMELEHDPGEYSADILPYYIGDAALTVRCYKSII